MLERFIHAPRIVVNITNRIVLLLFVCRSRVKKAETTTKKEKETEEESYF